MNFGERLRVLRGSMSQAAAAKRAGVSQQQWSKLERGIIDVEDSTKVRVIARAWGLTLEELLNGALPAPNPAMPIKEQPPAYPAKAAASPDEQLIETARALWDRACSSNRQLAVTIAKMIIVMVSGSVPTEAEIPRR